MPVKNSNPLHIQNRRSPAVLSTIFAFLFLLNSAQVFADSSVCGLDNSQRKWFEETLDNWEKVRKDSLYLPAAELPWLILFDEKCVWHINPEPAFFKSKNSTKLTFNRKSAAVFVTSHDGKVTLPDKTEVPARLLTFAANYGAEKKPFLVSAMPSIWQKAPHLKEEKNIEALVRSVFVHEMTHTSHQNYFAKLDEIEKRLRGAGNFDDDIIQNTFGKNEEFRRAYETEHDFLYRAVSETDRARKRELAGNALEAIRARRRQFYTGKDAVYQELEEIFLTMEGAANWAAYRSALEQGLSRPEALKLVRRSGKYWSQDEGIALFLVIDSLLPKWQKKAFGKSAVTVIDLLDEAVK